MSAELPPVTLDIVVDTSRLLRALRRANRAWKHAAIWQSYPHRGQAPYAHRARWRGRRPRR